MNDPFLEKLCQNCTEKEIIEIKSYLPEWSAATYLSLAHNILDHADRKHIDPLKLRNNSKGNGKMGIELR
jgi:hypothetical protein